MFDTSDRAGFVSAVRESAYRSVWAAVGSRFAGRVGLFLRVDDFDASYRRMLDHGVEFLSDPRDEPYGRFSVFVDVAGNKWDLLGPR